MNFNGVREYVQFSAGVHVRASDTVCGTMSERVSAPVSACVCQEIDWRRPTSVSVSANVCS